MRKRARLPMQGMDVSSVECHAYRMSSRRCVQLLLVLAGSFAGADFIQDPKPAKSPKAKQPDVRAPDGETLRRAQELSRTTVHHDRVKKLSGQWEVTVRSPLPGGKTREDKGTVFGMPTLGGRYVILSYKMSILGRDIEALQMIGFDTLRSQYTSTWRDNQTTWSVECAGEPGKEADLLELAGRLHDAESPGGKPTRLTFDLRTEHQVTVRIHAGSGEDAVLMQEQVWRQPG